MNKFIVIYFVIFLFQVIVAVDECTFSLEHGSPKMPLFLENSPPWKPVYPKNGAIRIPKNSALRLSCLDKKFKYFNAETLVVTCIQDDRVHVQNQEMYFVNLECRAYPNPKVQKRPDTTCFENGSLYDIGFDVEGEFRIIMGICYIQSEARTVYSYTHYNYTHLNYSDRKFENFEKTDFQDDGLYDFNITQMYTREHQRKQLTNLLESKIQAVRFLRRKNNKSLSKHPLISGPIIPASHFVYGYEKSATFHYLNTAPQWSVIKKGNWKTVEKIVKKQLLAGGDKLAMMSGTYGVAVLPNPENVEKELFLYTDEKNQRYLPVPKFFWKLIYNKEQKRGEVIIGVNNPHLSSIPKDYYLCEDICSKLKWFSMERNNISEGYVYCCEMDAFLNATGIENVFEDRPTISTSTEAPDCSEFYMGACSYPDGSTKQLTSREESSTERVWNTYPVECDDVTPCF